MAVYTLRYFAANGKTARKNAGVEATREFDSDEAAIGGFQKVMDEFREFQARYYDTVTFMIWEGGRQIGNA